MDETSSNETEDQQMMDDSMSQRSSSSLGFPFDEEFVAKVAECKMQYPDMFVSDFFNDESGIQPPPDIEKDVNARMLWAAEHGNLDIVEELYRLNPELIKVKDSDQYTPLHRACYNNHANVVQFLMGKRAQLDAKTEDGWQPLHSAARWGSYFAAKLLINSGQVNINALTNGYLTPLHLAVSSTEEKAADVVKLLLQQPSILIDIKDKAGDTAYDLARQSSAEMMQLFEQKQNDQ